jgi:arsenite-transporting ATPase
MIEPLLARLPARIILVGGKGGVGKTTTAGAIALALADRGESVQLLSTDPAHSISDLFDGQACSERLAIEEFDARSYADAFFRRVRPALVTLMESGTYLDKADSGAFFDLSVPGIDEVMAALRLVDLSRAGKGRVVVDTAPTGHTMRLLDAPRLLRSWAATGRAMAAKATAVAEQLMRQEVRFEAENVLDEIANYATSFETLLRAASFVVVTRSGRVVQAETERFREALAQRNVRPAATITDRATSHDEQTFVTARLAVATGCSALREWAARLGEVQTDARISQSARGSGDAARTIARTSARLIWVAGKGGVGKSTCAAAIATLLSETRNVCLVSTDPAGSLGEIFERDVTNEGTRISKRLFVRQIDAPAQFERMRDQYHDAVETVFASLGLDGLVQLDRRVIETLFDFAPPGIDEIIALIEIMERASEYEVTIIDSAPTGHFLRLLEMPDIALQWVHALMRLVLKYRSAASLDALGRDLLAFSKRLRQLQLDLSARETTAVFVVTLAEPMVTAETQRLCDALQHAHIPVAAIILNRADAGRAHSMRGAFSQRQIIRAPDEAAEITGVPALRAFMTRWENIGE